MHYRSSCVFSLGGWAPHLRTVLACTVLLARPSCWLDFRLQDSHLLWLSFPAHSTNLPSQDLTGCSAFARHYSQNDLFSSGYLDVSVPQVPYPYLCVQYGLPGYKPLVGFPIRRSPANTVAHTSPELIAVYHVLLRHMMPRHPPYALTSFYLLLEPITDTERLIFYRAYVYF